MADGDVLDDTGIPGSYVRRWRLIDAKVATGNGVWVDTGPFTENGTLHVDGITTATIEVRGSDATAKPADNTHGDIIGSAQTADVHLDLTNVPRWLKVRVTAWTSGTIDVTFRAST